MTTPHEGCPLGQEAETFSRRLRELENSVSSHQVECGLRNKASDEYRQEIKSLLDSIWEDLEQMKLTQAKWLGAIAVIAFVASMLGAAAARALAMKIWPN